MSTNGGALGSSDGDRRTIATTRRRTSACRILVVEPAGNLWGSERSLLALLEALPKGAQGSQLQVAICCPPRTPIVAELKRLQLKVYPWFIANLHLKTRVSRCFALIGLLMATLLWRPKVLYVNQAGVARITLWVARMTGAAVVVHVRLAEDVSYMQRLGSQNERVAKIICISEYIYRLFSDTSDATNCGGGGRAPASSRLAMKYDSYVADSVFATRYNAYSMRKPRTGPAAAELVKSAGAKLEICCVGRLCRQKGQDVLIRAAGCLKREGLQVRLRMVGTAGPKDRYGDYLKHVADEEGLSGQVEWLGFQADVFPTMRLCSLHVIPSHQEPLGRVVFESWDAGIIPVVWNGSGGAAEIIERSGGGLLYSQQSGESLAGVLKTVHLMSDCECQQFVLAGRRWLLENCDPIKYADFMSDIWQDANNRAASP